MTPDQLRKIDKLVAEKVMGWRGEDEFSPSQNIADAWVVVEKMRARHMVNLFTDESDLWHVHFLPRNEDTPMICEDDHENTQIAICLAALKGVGVDVKEFE